MSPKWIYSLVTRAWSINKQVMICQNTLHLRYTFVFCSTTPPPLIFLGHAVSLSTDEMKCPATTMRGSLLEKVTSHHIIFLEYPSIQPFYANAVILQFVIRIDMPQIIRSLGIIFSAMKLFSFSQLNTLWIKNRKESRYCQSWYPVFG